MRNENELIGIFEKNYSSLSKLAIMILKDKAAALDVMQNVALVILTKAYQLSQIEKPIPFLATCVRRAALNYLRDEAKTISTDPVLLEETHDDVYSHTAIDYLEWVMMLEKYLVTYSPELQNAFIKHYVDGYPLDTVAKDIGLSPNALSQQFRRMRKKIADQSPKYGALLTILSFL